MRGGGYWRGGKAAGEYPEADLVFVGPMRRCLETAEVLYPGAGAGGGRGVQGV